MGRSPIKRQAGQTQEELTAQMMEAKKNISPKAHLYKPQYNEVAEKLKTQQLAAAIDQQKQLLAIAAERGRVDLDDLDTIKAAVDVYLESCKAAGIAPSMMGLAPSLGYTRASIYRYIQKSNTDSARFLDSLRSSWAAIIQQMGLSRTYSEAVSIFVLKNAGQDMLDRHELTAVPAGQQDDNEISKEELERFFLDDEQNSKDTNAAHHYGAGYTFDEQ